MPPFRAKTICNKPGCGKLTDDGAYCEAHKQYRRQIADAKRENSSKRLYNYAWQKARKYYLQRNPLCRTCKKQGITKQANVVDHIIPHKGDYDLFWDEDNWQSMCKECHDIKTAREDGAFGRHKGG
jgi:5-methylcytosine-specific restriction protein A